MKLAQRVTHMAGHGSDGWEIYYAARDLRAAGVQVINLTIGEHDVSTDPAILGAMYESARAGNTGYTIGAGKPVLRRAIAERVEARTGVRTRPENVIVTPGGQAALFAAHMVTLDAGCRGLYCDPYYATYPATIRATGATDVAVPTLPENGFQPEPDAIASLADNARTLLINTPNNPTGVVYSRATLEGIARVVLDRDLWLISDEVYDTQIWSGEHLSPRTLPGMADRTIVIGSLSKSHAMTGSRIGWLVAPEEIVSAVADLATNTTYGIPGFIMDAGLFALGLGSDFEVRIGAPFRRRRQIALDAFAGSNKFRLVPSGGAMFVMLDVRATGLSGFDFASRLLEAERIAVMPGESFGSAAAGHVRIAMTVSDDAFRDALTRLLAFAETLTVTA
ncbi:aminotransferase class I/II-fold pyridoxal phosphate-dependent enzyme [Defluviimonas sp. WL0002]|uniref:Aminotransferase n=1 Tax=Albidovulum marisflavi TaxID=2984159 RepID=A0ABT2ZHF0_9RHOB|nr:aminotransferase class I/II-fold pyridoxal phosphate-dependent enzyme [Defluviimonas sp. WL0002]MCV2870563.1 aminotransferase class I/II-fold pyridoxal phosphate-dependent enzyme [Defluviimonas sp. WL0002]